MSYTPAQAREYMQQTFWATWKDPAKGWAGITDYAGQPIPLAEAPEIDWDNDEPDDAPCTTAPVLYFYVRHYNSSAATVGGETRKINTRKGFVLIRVWVPGDVGLKTADALAYVSKTAFERKRGIGAGNGIVFRSWRPTEAGAQKDGRFLTVCTVDFEYDEITGV